MGDTKKPPDPDGEMQNVNHPVVSFHDGMDVGRATVSWPDNCSMCETAKEKFDFASGAGSCHCFACGKCQLSTDGREIEDMNSDYFLKGIETIHGVLKSWGNSGYVWVCSSCKVELPKLLSSKDSVPAASNQLSELSAIQAQLKEITDNMNTRFHSLSEDILLVKDQINCTKNSFPVDSPAVALNSPLRKRPKSVQNVHGTGQSTLLPQPRISSESAAVLKLNYPAAKQNTSLFKEMCTIKRQSGATMPNFVQSRKSNDGSINVLFKSFKDALETKKMFEDKIDKLKLPDPVHKKMKRLDVVGLDFELTKEEAMESLIHENPGLGLSQSKNDNCSAFVQTNPDLFISVLDVKKCQNSDSFRVLFRATNSFIEFLGKQNIVLMHTVTHKYVHAESKLCYKCHRVGHFASKCTEDTVCGKCASTSHNSNECKSLTNKCINCVRNNNPDTAHTVFSHTCPFLADLSKS